MAIAIATHLLAAIIWVGGMFFAYLCLRPAAASVLEPPLRLTLWQQTLQRFFRWVWLAVVVLLGSGHGMIALFGGMASVGLHVHLMLAIGYLMVALYAYLYLRPFAALTLAVSEQRWPDAGAALNRIRQIVATNLTLGLITAVVAGGGRYLPL
jgi:uncharacterized membrane protein